MGHFGSQVGYWLCFFMLQQLQLVSAQNHAQECSDCFLEARGAQTDGAAYILDTKMLNVGLPLFPHLVALPTLETTGKSPISSVQRFF